MKQIIKTLKAGAMVLTLVVPQMATAQDACYVDYKAKQSGSGALQLHYGVMRLKGPACSNSGLLEKRVSKRIAVDNWILLRVLSQFEKSGLNQRRANAGQYFLRY